MSDAEIEQARAASGEELAQLLHHPSMAVLAALLQNPALGEDHLCRLLERKDLSGEFLAAVAQDKAFAKTYRVKRALAFHPHTPRVNGLRLLRELYLMDLAQLALSPSAPAELRRSAEDQISARLPQLPLGQKITLARRGPGRIAGMLLGEGHPQVLNVALDNANLTESHVLKALSREKLPALVAQSVARHSKWSRIYNVRLALVRQPGTPLSAVLSFLPELTVSDLRELAAPGIVPETLRRYLVAEVHKRMQRPGPAEP